MSISAGGVISGVPTVGVSNITVTATQGSCSNFISYTLTVTCPTISFTAIPISATTSVSGANYSYTVVQSGLSVPIFSATGLPSTLSISAGGVISGVPTVGVSNITVTATQGGCSNFISYTLTVSQNPTTNLSNSLSNQIKIFPNPTNGDFSIDFGSLNLGKSQLYLYNSQGKEVFSSEISSNLMKIKLENVSNGIYLLEVRNAQWSISKRIIKK